jgi:AP-3 complex subunit mu
MLQNLFILSSSGEVLIEKHWRGRVKRTVVDLFLEKQQQAKHRFEVCHHSLTAA